MKTSYYAKASRLNRDDYFLVQISRWPCRWCKVDASCLLLAPPVAAFKSKTVEAFIRAYVRELDRVGLPAVQEELSKLRGMAGEREVLLLCFEKAALECHRGILSQWIQQEGGPEIPEL